MMHQFEILCKKCGARGSYDPENNDTVRIYFEKGSQAIMDRVVIYCSKCCSKQETGICWSLNTNAILTPVEADAESQCILENPCSDDTPGDCDEDCIYFRTA